MMEGSNRVALGDDFRKETVLLSTPLGQTPAETLFLRS